MRGAVIITIAAFLSRVLGSIYRPVAQIFIGDAGLALVTPPAAAYQVILALSAVGLNVAISRLVSERLAVADYRGARHVFRVSVVLLLISGLCFGLLFALGAKWMARVQGFPEAWLGFMVLAPAIPLATLVAAFRGLYQGMQQMKPSAISQVAEQAGRVGLGLIMVAVLARYGVTMGAAAFNAGSTVGVLLGVAYALWIYTIGRPAEKWSSTADGVVSLAQEPQPKLLGRILSIAVPLSIIGALLPVMQQIDALIVTNRLLGVGVEPAQAKEALAYLANAATLRDLPSILTMALYVSLVPAVTESIATGRVEEARRRAATALRVTLLIALPATAGLLVAARAAYGIFFTGPGYLVMAPLALSTLFLMLQQTAAGTLQGMGLIGLTVRNMLAGVLVKIVLTYWWTAVPTWGAVGAAYASVAAFGAIALLNLLAVRRRLQVSVSLQADIGRPLLATALMVTVIWLVEGPLWGLIGHPRLAGLAVVAAGGLVYLVAIFGLRGVTEADLAALPGFRQRWIEGLRRRGLLRP